MKGCIVIICNDYVTSSENYIAKIKYFRCLMLDTILFLALSLLLHVLLMVQLLPHLQLLRFGAGKEEEKEEAMR